MEQTHLLELTHRSLAEAMREITRRSHGAVHEEKGLLLYASGPPDPVLWNGALRTDPGLAAADIVARARDFFGERRRGFTLHTMDCLDADIDAVMKSAGRAPDSDSPEMILETPIDGPAVPVGVRLQEVETEVQRADFLMVVASAFHHLGVAEETWRAAYPDVRSLVAPHIAAFIAYVQSAPAAAAMMYLNSEVAEVIHVATSPAYRHKGLAELVTRAVTNAGFHRGARLASLQATPMGEGVYRRIGFRTIARYRWYVHPPKEGVER